MNPNNN